MAGQIPAATFVELPGGPHFAALGDWEAIVDEVHAFLGGFGSAASGRSPSGTGR